MQGEIEFDLHLLDDCNRCFATGRTYNEQLREFVTCPICKGTRQKLSADGHEMVRLLLWIENMGGLSELT